MPWAKLSREVGDEVIPGTKWAYCEGMWDLVRAHLPPWPAEIVELGSMAGGWVVPLMRRFEYRIARVWCVDVWHGKWLPIWIRNVAPWLLTHIFPLRGHTRTWIHGFPQEIEIDILYVDADHHYNPVREDLENWVPRVRPGGLVLMHDWQEGGVRRAAEEKFGRRTLQHAKIGPGPRAITCWTRKPGP